jgi:hypothetical protein
MSRQQKRIMTGCILTSLVAGCASPEAIQKSRATVVFPHTSPKVVVDSECTALNPGDSAVVQVWARLPRNHTGIWVTGGSAVRFSIPPRQQWTDWVIQTDGGGYPHGPIPFLQERFASTKPLPGENWFALVGAIEGSPSSPFLIGGKGRVVDFSDTGELVLFANDARSFYGNNFGRLQVIVTRLH